MRKPTTKITGFAGHHEPDTKAVTRQTVFGPDCPPLGKRLDSSILGLLNQYNRTVFAATNKIAEKISSIDCRLYSTAKGFSTKAIKGWRAKRLQTYRKKYLVTGGDDVTEITSHPVINLLNRPNPKMTGRDLLVFTQLYQDVAGVCYWRLMAGGVGAAEGQPDQIHILPPHLVKKESGSDFYTYGNEKINPNELLVLSAANLLNPYADHGTSGVAAVLQSLELQEALTATLAAIMANEGRPSGILSPRGEYNGLGEEEAERLRRKATQFNRGGSGQLMVLEGDMAYTPLSYKPADLSPIPIDQHAVEQICQALGLPLMIFRGVEGGSRAAYETALQEWCDGGLSSRLRALEDFLNVKLLPRFTESDSQFFCFDDPSPQNEAETEQRVTSLVTSNVAFLNEGRAMLGLDPVDGGDVMLATYLATASPMAPAAADAPAEPAADLSAAPVETSQEIETNPQLTLNGSQVESGSAIVREVANGQLSRASGLGQLQILLNLSEQQALTMMADVGLTFFAPAAAEPSSPPPDQAPQKRLIIPDSIKPVAKSYKPIEPVIESPELEKVLVKHFKQVFGDIEQSIKHITDDITTKALPRKFIPVDKWEKDLADDSQPVIEMIYRQGVKKMRDRIVQRVGASTEVPHVQNEHVAKRARAAALELAQSTIDTTTKAVNDALDQTRESLAEGLEEGESVRKLTNRVKEIFESAENFRAERIARTESVRASSEGLRDQAVESGVVKSFEWISSSDPCPLCAEMNGKEIPLKGDLPPLHPNCQCTLLENISDD